MVGKLLKYDFKANARKILPLVSVYIFVAILVAIFSQFELNVAATTGIAVFGGLTVAIMVIYLLSVVQHFNSSMYGKEGYLTGTLPVNAPQLLGSKVTSAFLVGLICLAAGTIASLILAAGLNRTPIVFADIFIHIIFSEVLLALIYLVTVSFMAISLIFLSCSISALPWIKNRHIGTITGLAFCFFSLTVITRIGVALMNTQTLSFVVNNAPNINFSSHIGIFAYTIVIGLICFFATCNMFNKHKTL